MPKELYSALLLSSLAAAPVSTSAQPPVPGAGPDAQRGRQIVIEYDCTRCHGEQGQGDPDEGVPRLAGQSRFYLYKQLQDFAQGSRPSEDMTEVVADLSVGQMADAAAYFSMLRQTPYPPQPAAAPARLQVGGKLSALGESSRDIQACALCHADFGAGLPPSFPYLAGQHAGYTERQLLLWKRGQRKNDPLNVMADIADALTEDEIRALAVYFSRVRLSPDAINDLTPSEP